MHKKVGIIGRFGFGKQLLNGQTIKTKTLADAVSGTLGKDKILYLDTYGGVKMLMRLPERCIQILHRCSDLIILPAHKGVRVIVPLLVFLNAFFHRKLHYVVIGAWLCNLLDGKWFLTQCLKRFDYIYTETTSMKRKLEKMGFDNVVLMPNFKRIPLLDGCLTENHQNAVCRVCTFSRVMREKGIETAVNAVTAINSQLEEPFYYLDIYGQVDLAQQEWFAKLQESFPEYVRYGGEVPSEQSVSTLCKYNALLFPTEFYTEGIPGSIIDAYAAGIPVIASKWENYADIIEDEETGIGYDFDDSSGLYRILLSMVGDMSTLTSKREACRRKAYEFLPESVIDILLSRLEFEKQEGI